MKRYTLSDNKRGELTQLYDNKLKQLCGWVADINCIKSDEVDILSDIVIIHGGRFHGGYFYGGRFGGGQFYKGTFHDGEFHGGRFHGGRFYGGRFGGGEFHGGRFYGGRFGGGEFHGGEFHGGEFHGGVYTETPFQFFGFEWPIVLQPDGKINIGCKSFTYDEWISFSDDEFHSDASSYVDEIRCFLKNNKAQFKL